MEYLGFSLDPFQEQAVSAIDQGHSVIVAAPTGCGKTLIAEYAIELCLRQGRRTVYTAPIKTLSNQKYRDFRARFGDAAVGIHTGDVTINPEAPILIMTTEIFRNMILEKTSRLDNVLFTVFDEIHYLDDPERGTVWEECIILAPRHIQFVCLSATVPNIHELSAWMEMVRDVRFVTIVEEHRPVPLQHYLYSARHGTITLQGIRRLYRKNEHDRKRFLRMKPSSKKIVLSVLQMGREPILYFCFNRRACERNADMHAGHNLLDPQEQQASRELIDTLVAQYHLDEYERTGPLRMMWEAGCAFHHAGMLPAAKEVVERLFTRGLIKLLFCTETFALGVNMPACTVIFDELEKFNGVEFKFLMTRNYNQMAGRAGRRGMDPVGYVYAQVVPEAADPKEIERIQTGRNEEIRSRFIASYSTILTLYSQFGEGAFDLFRKCLRNYRNGNFEMSKAYRKEEVQIRNRIAFLQAVGFLDGDKLTDKGRLAAAVNGYEIQAAQLYYTRAFDDLPVDQIPVVLGALVTEERRGRNRDGAHGPGFKIRADAEKVINDLRRKEMKFGVAAPVRALDYAFAAPIYSWARGCTLADLLSYGFPEGALIRVMRMTIQLLRTLRDRLPDPVIAERMDQALELINRGVVDAQAELEVG